MTPIFSHMVSRTIFLTVFLLWSTLFGSVRAEQLTVSADGRPVTTGTLQKDRLYRIIVQGTVSAGTSAECAAIDALWVYDVPASERARGHIPTDADIYVGGDTVFRWQMGTASYLFQASQQIGLRLNGRALPHRYLEPERHRYMFEIIGAGEPVVLQFVDREYAGPQPTDSLVDAYADNCGAFSITIEDAHPQLQMVCGVDVERRSRQGRVVRLRVPPSIARATLYVNGEITRVDSILCPPTPPPNATFFLLDRSGSISQRDMEVAGVRLQRSEVTDMAVRRALFRLQQQDTVGVAAFAARMQKPSDWVSPPYLLAEHLDAIPQSATNLYGALKEMADHVRSTKGRASVVMFTDGGNRFPEFDPASIVTSLNAIGGNVGIVLLPDETPDVTAENRRQLASNLQGVDHLRIRQVGPLESTGSALDLLLEDLDLSQCCTLVFTLPLCTSSSLSELATIQLDTFQTTLSIPCSPALDMEGDVAVRIVPTPSDAQATIEITSLISANVSVNVYDVAGKVMVMSDPFVLDPGMKIITYDTRFWANGVYIVHVVANSELVAAQLLVLH
jgi:hypothetical protein